MPGRWSKGAGELHLLPMLFDEWCAMRKMAGWEDLWVEGWGHGGRGVIGVDSVVWLC